MSNKKMSYNLSNYIAEHEYSDWKKCFSIMFIFNDFRTKVTISTIFSIIIAATIELQSHVQSCIYTT